MIHATEVLSEFIYSLKYEDFDEKTVETTKYFVIDYYAAAFAGFKVNKTFGDAVRELLDETGGKEECDYLLGKKRLPCMNAAFINACYVHGADMDDGNRKAMGHVGAHVISTVLTLAQTLPVNGKDVITAINAGYEVYNRVAAAVQPGLVHRGFHSTGTAGAIACGAAAAKLMGLDKKGIYNAMALSAIQASGLIIIAESGQCCKPVNPANAARTGIFSAKLVAKGVESAIFPLESTKGWFHAMSDEIDESMITDGLGKVFTVCESYLKPYPSCRHTHCGIEAILDIRRRLPENTEIKSVKVYIYKNAIQIAGQIKEPKTPDDTKFSVHYSLATAFVKGHFNLSDLDVSKRDDRVYDIVSKTELIEDASMENRDAGIRGARVVIETADGKEYEKTVLIPKGDAANPFSLDDLKEKMSGCAEGVISRQRQEKLIENILKLETFEKFETVNIF